MAVWALLLAAGCGKTRFLLVRKCTVHPSFISKFGEESLGRKYGYFLLSSKLSV
jgi:hypothetical protein